MKKILVIGSTVADVILKVDHIPQRSHDINIQEELITPGGCSFNVASMISHLGGSVTLISPVGHGYYGNFVADALSNSKIHTPLGQVPGKNGCCYCIVDATGERTFMCNRGVEYDFKEEYFQGINPNDYQYIYICGLDLEKDSGNTILRFLQMLSEPGKIFFAPGPRLATLDRELIMKILHLKPLLHMNLEEALILSKIIHNEDFITTSSMTATKAIHAIYEFTQMPVIVTGGACGAFGIDDNKSFRIPAVAARQVVDTIGAGDGHAGAVLAALAQGLDLKEAIKKGNFFAARIVEKTGATL